MHTYWALRLRGTKDLACHSEEDDEPVLFRTRKKAYWMRGKWGHGEKETDFSGDVIFIEPIRVRLEVIE